ncbi:GntR family transcriptional regulator [Streptomyces sp. NBC_00006]|uniref:GntR family transcriptional regulator n=1 Tax=Streptomyces sp. NBC_00006 TaxID=2975619 RepID=UPI00224F9BDB|nr:GntR family transcriptional regulator [Streptomyces sp. NBC_00006]MCX5528967.1 GntR family transcriptional regulator [Streptomyces sp. NBC_00006]MCX5537801.1 GntR family transcriptional regulator [Streptomyces sp. NBC_00006]
MTKEQPEDGSIYSSQEQIAAFLRDRILNGGYEPGEKLPSLHQLQDQFSVAPNTARAAITTLTKEGLAVAQHGRGVIVRPHRRLTMRPAAYKTPAPGGEKYQWLTENEKRGLAAKSKLLAVKEVTPPPAVREVFSLTEEELILLRRQLLTLDGEPCELVEVYLPLEIARGTKLTNNHLLRGGSGRVLENLGFPTVRCEDKVSAQPPTPEQAAALKMPTKLPVLRTFRTTFSTDDRPVQVEIMAKAGHMSELQYDF